MTTNRKRSPEYPSLGLVPAIARAKQFYGVAHDHFASIEAAAKCWKYSVKSSGLLQTIAALKHFGLLKEKGSNEDREFQLTSRGLDVALHDENSPEYRQAAQDAALTPAIHRELWDKYRGKIPDDMVIRPYLLRQRPGATFNPAHVDGFIGQFRDTLAYAKLDGGDKLEGSGDGDDDGGSNGDEVEIPPKPPKGRRLVQTGTKEDVFSLDEGPVVLTWPERLSKTSAEDLTDWLELIGRKIKRASESSPPDEESDGDEAGDGR